MLSKSNKNLRLQVRAISNDLRKLSERAPEPQAGSPEVSTSEMPKTTKPSAYKGPSLFRRIRRQVTLKRVLTAILIPVAGLIFKVERDREAQIRDQQAQLFAIGPLAMPERGKPYTAQMVIRNVGKTTAYRTGGEVKSQTRMGYLGGNTPDPEFDALNYHSQHLLDIPAQSAQFASITLAESKGATEPARIAELNSWYDLMDNGDAVMFIFGGDTYTTEFGDTGVLKYCYRYQPRSRLMESCGGTSNQSYVIQKGWFQTLWSAIPGWSGH